MGIIYPTGWLPPIPENSKKEYYFSELQENEYRNLARMSHREYVPKLAILKSGDLVEYTEEFIIDWAVHQNRDPHNIRFSDSIYLGEGEAVNTKSFISDLEKEINEIQ